MNSLGPVLEIFKFTNKNDKIILIQSFFWAAYFIGLLTLFSRNSWYMKGKKTDLGLLEFTLSVKSSAKKQVDHRLDYGNTSVLY